jgi:murein hydrolase activator
MNLMKLWKYLFFFLFTITAFAQKAKDRATLEKEKKQNLLKIQKVNKILSETKLEKQNSLSQIQVFNEQINNKESKIELAKEDISLITTEMVGLKQAQNELFVKLKSLQDDYSEIIYRESKNANKLNGISFLFSANSVSELFMRYKYLQQYSDNKKNQLKEINEVGQELKERQLLLLSKKKNQLDILNEIKSEADNLVELKEKQSSLLVELSSKETELKAELDLSKKAISDLNSRISNVISKDVTAKKKGRGRTEEFEKREREMLKARGKTAETSASNASTSSEPTIASSSNSSGGSSSNRNFGAYKSKLSWPVDGFISDRFGVKNHPVLRGLKIDNNGVDIKTSGGSQVHAVFEGTVLDISSIPGLNNVIAIQHGEYYTVYANVGSVSVRVNQTVGKGQTIGTAASKDGGHEINFQIWHNFSKLNPEPWLGSK